MPVVILFDGLEEDRAFEYERAWISALGRCDRGMGPLLNHTDGGEGPSGFVHTLEARQRMSRSHKGKTFSEDHKAKLLVVSKKPRSDTFKSRLSASRLGVRPSPETRAKLREAHMGQQPSEETRRKMSLAQSARWKRQKETFNA